jgi:hypothetical protein
MTCRRPPLAGRGFPPGQIRFAGTRQLSEPGAASRRIDPIHAWDESDSGTSAGSDTPLRPQPTSVALAPDYDGSILKEQIP